LLCNGCGVELQENISSIILTKFEKAKEECKMNNLSESFVLFNEVLSLIEHNKTVISSSKDLMKAHLSVLDYLGSISLDLGNRKISFDYYLECKQKAADYNSFDYEINSTERLHYYFKDFKDGSDCLSFLNSDSTLISELDLIYDKYGKVYIDGRWPPKLYRGELYTHLEKKAEAYMRISKLYYSSKDYGKVDSFLNMAKSLSKDDILLNKKIEESYLRLYDVTGKTNKSIQTLNKLREIENTLDNEINKIEVVFIDKLKNENLKVSLKLTKTRIKYISGIAILFLLLLSLLYFYTMLRFRHMILRFKHNKLELESINKALEVRNEEQTRFASILHDIVGANLSAISMQLSIFKKHIPPDSYNSTKETLTKTIHEVRNLSHLMEPPALKRYGLIGAISEKAEEYTNNNFEIEVTSTIKNLNLKDHISHTLYSVLLELINNTIKYSKATNMIIHFSNEKKGNLSIKVSDNGVGFDVKKLEQSSKCLGLVNIKSKIKDLGGSFDIDSSNEGTSIDLIIPV